MKTENNTVILTGEIVEDFIFSHEAFGEKFYMFGVKVLRASGTFDVLPVLISERLANVKESCIGAFVRIDGQLRSYNKNVNGKSHVILSVFVNEIENVEQTSFDENEVTICGFICKEPIYRKTPRGREIADLIVAVNRPNGKSDYIPCIVWGRDASFVCMQGVGAELKLNGRFQSRKYKKRISEEEFETRTAFELSVHRLEVVNNECE